MSKLLRATIALIEQKGWTSAEVHKRYGVGITWFSDVRAGRTKAPSVHTVERIYEDLTGCLLLEVGDQREEAGPQSTGRSTATPGATTGAADTCTNTVTPSAGQ